MKIQIPHFIQDEEVEGAKILLACLYKLAAGDFKGYRYYIDARDVRAMMQRFQVDPTPLFGKYAHWIRIGKCSDTHWMIDWQREPHTVEHEIELEELKRVWSYLIGRIGGPNNIVEDWNQRGYPTREKEWVTNWSDRLFFASGSPKPSDTKERERRAERRRAQELLKPKKKNGRPKGSKNKNNQ